MSMNPLHNYDQWKAGDYSATVDEWEDWAERIVAAFRAELKAADNDHKRYKELEAENEVLKRAWERFKYAEEKSIGDMAHPDYVDAFAAIDTLLLAEVDDEDE